MRYEKKCYSNMRSKAYMSQINLLIFRFVMYLANKLLSLSCPVVRFLTFLYVYLSELNSFFGSRVCLCYMRAAEAVLKKGSYEQSMRLCEENSKKVEQKFTDKMKDNNVRLIANESVPKIIINDNIFFLKHKHTPV